MNCKDLQELLLAYANGELKGTQKTFIEEHLESCADCRLALAQYQKTREKLLALRKTPELPEIKEEIMTEIKMMKTGFRRFLRPAAIAVPVMLIVALILSLQFTGVFDGSSGVIAKAYAANSGLESFRYINDQYSQYEKDEEPVLVYRDEVEYTQPDSFHCTTETFSTSPIMRASKYEVIRIGETIYTDRNSIYPLDDRYFENRLPSEEKTVEMLNLLGKTQTLDDEMIDGTDCYHYQGTVDMDKYIEYMRADYTEMYYSMDKKLPNGMFDDLETWLDEATDRYLTQEISLEFWIGKDDYIMRQFKMIQTTRDGEEPPWGIYSSRSDLTYYDVNEPIVIESPLDENGELWDGWHTYEIEYFEIPETTEKIEEVVEIGTPRPSTGIDGLPDFIDPNLESAVDLTSFRSTGETWEYIDGKFVNSVNSILEYGGYNLLHSQLLYTEAYNAASPLHFDSMDIIIVGDQGYTNMGTPLPSYDDYNESRPTEDVIRLIDQLYSIEILPEETINGVECYHIRGIQDTEMYLEWYYPEWKAAMEIMTEMIGVKMDTESSWAQSQETMRSREVVFEYWFGKDDYIIRKQIRLERDLIVDLPAVDDTNHESTRMITHYYYDINEPVTIDEPLDGSGNLLDGWLVTTLD